MAEYLIQGETLSDIANAIRAKSGSTAAIKVSDFAAEIENISGGGPSEKVILAEQTFDNFVFESTYNAYICNLVPAPYALTVGETYFVKWDGTEYECVAQDLSAMSAGMVAIGNISDLTGGGAGNNEPFIINYVQGANAGGFLAFDNKTSHTVKIYQKVSGGGSVEGVHFVTFMSEDGSGELYKRPVADGDDCADPVIRGLIDEPTKESTAQYAYTLAGWSASPNGALDSNILKAVTADKTVYANFAAVLRYYTVTYYDSDGTTVLKTESLAYGATPSYKPTKEHYEFVAWSPAISTVTGNISYTATWKELPAFSEMTWEEIISVCNAGNAASTFAVGDTKTITAGGKSVVLRIIGFNHDDLADGSGKASMTILSETLFDEKSTADNWANLSSFMSTTYKPKLPSALRNAIKTVTKQCSAFGYKNGDTPAPVNENFELFPLSYEEMKIRVQGSLRYGTTAWNGYFTNLGTPYAYFEQKYVSYYYGPPKDTINIYGEAAMIRQGLRYSTSKVDDQCTYLTKSVNEGSGIGKWLYATQSSLSFAAKVMFAFCI